MNYSVAAVLRAVVTLNLDHFPVNLPLHGSCFIGTEQTLPFRGIGERTLLSTGRNAGWRGITRVACSECFGSLSCDPHWLCRRSRSLWHLQKLSKSSSKTGYARLRGVLLHYREISDQAEHKKHMKTLRARSAGRHSCAEQPPEASSPVAWCQSCSHLCDGWMRCSLSR